MQWTLRGNYHQRYGCKQQLAVRRDKPHDPQKSYFLQYINVCVCLSPGEAARYLCSFCINVSAWRKVCVILSCRPYITICVSAGIADRVFILYVTSASVRANISQHASAIHHRSLCFCSFNCAERLYTCLQLPILLLKKHGQNMAKEPACTVNHASQWPHTNKLSLSLSPSCRTWQSRPSISRLVPLRSFTLSRQWLFCILCPLCLTLPSSQIKPNTFPILAWDQTLSMYQDPELGRPYGPTPLPLPFWWHKLPLSACYSVTCAAGGFSWPWFTIYFNC